MVVSFRFFLTLNPDDGSKPTPTMETHVPPEGDGKSPPACIHTNHLELKDKFTQK